MRGDNVTAIALRSTSDSCARARRRSCPRRGPTRRCVASRGGEWRQANAALRVVGGGCGAGVGQPRGQRARLRRRAVLVRGARGHPVPGGRRLLRELLLCRLAPRPTARRAQPQPQPQPLGVPSHAVPRGNSLLRGRLLLCRNLRLRCHQSLQAPQQRARLRGVPGGALLSAAVAARPASRAPARARGHAHGAPGRPPAALPHRRARRTAALLRIARRCSGRGGEFRASRKRTQRRSCATTAAAAAAAAATAAEAARDVTRPHTAAGGRACVRRRKSAAARRAGNFSDIARGVTELQ